MIAAFVQGPLIRVIPVGVILLALQRTIFLEVRAWGIVLQVVVAFAAAAGVAGGSERGAVVGFTVGLMYDLVEATPLGSTAIAMTVAAVVAGLVALITVEPRWWLAALFVALGTAVGELTIPVVRLFTGESDPFDERLVVIVPVVAAFAAQKSPVLVPLARWCLRIKRAEWKAPRASSEEVLV
jgi:rod shape-determining protein MreD